jgi:hypothetical protein
MNGPLPNGLENYVIMLMHRWQMVANYNMHGFGGFQSENMKCGYQIT